MSKLTTKNLGDEIAKAVKGAVDRLVQNAGDESSPVVEGSTRAKTISAEEFVKFLKNPETANRTIAENAAVIGMNVSSFRTRYSQTRTQAKALGLTLPEMKDGRKGRTGKRVEETATQKALKAWLAN